MNEDEYRRRKRTLRADNRGQTLQDFILGISLFIVTVTFVLGLFPSFLSPFTTGSGGEERAQADRVARSMVVEHATQEGQTSLNASQLQDVLDNSQSDLRSRYGLPENAGINVTVRDLDGNSIISHGGAKLATEKKRKNQTASSVARVITFDPESVPASDPNPCKPGCRLVVKVW
jgi:hypothetical protein